MRILQICSADAWGGGESHVAALSAGLRARGHEVLIAGRRRGAFAAEAAIHLPFRNAADVSTMLRLRRRVRELQCDIVHAHLARDYPAAAAAVGGGRRTRLVCTRHLLYPVRRHPLQARVAGWIAPAAGIAEALARLRPRALRVIPNGVDLDGFAFRAYAPRCPLRLGLLGQISPHKGHDEAIAAMRRLGAGFQLRIAGAGDAAYLRRLRAAAAGLPVHFEAFTAAARFLADTDVLLVPSREEPFGMVVLEAMAAGTAVVATAAGGPADIITPGRDGVLVPPRDPAGLAAAVRALAADPSATAALTRRARATVEARYSAQRMAELTEAFYRELLGEAA